MKTLVKVKFGSYLYGTSTPTSDLDYKSVVVPSGLDIVMQKAKEVIQHNTKTDSTQKNSAEDVDDELIALHKFMKMLTVGDMISSEILFAPDWSIVENSVDWKTIQKYRPLLVHKQVKGFVGYCQKQAAKYGIKGSRVAVMRGALELIENSIEGFGGQAKVVEVATCIENFVQQHKHEHTDVIQIPLPTGAKLPHWEVCDRKIPYSISLINAHAILKKVFDNYGHRALQAETNNGVDFKALSHAVRVGQQAIELLNTGNITFPRPNAEELLYIKLGNVPYKEIAPRLEELLEEVERVSITSKLREEPNRGLMDEIVYNLYSKEVINYDGIR